MTPLERAVRALEEALPDTLELAERGLYPDDLRTGVIAVLTSIREPSAAMDRAAAECESSYVGDVYTAMIDAALAEEG